MPDAHVLSQGDEVVTGQIADTNAAWLSDQLTTIGFTVRRHLSVGDRLPDLVEAFRDLASRGGLCICTGGLGPTDDDLTTRAVADAFGRPLELDDEALRQIRERYAHAGRQMPAVNERQAWLPRGSTRLDNDWGTAPGFAFDESETWFACLPGVPREMRNLFRERVLPVVRSRYALRPGRLVTLRCVGVGESNLQQVLNGWQASGCTLSFRTKLPENHIKLRFEPSVNPDAVIAATESILQRVGRWVFTIEGAPSILVGFDTGGGSHTETVARLVAARGHTLALAESCTGGRIAAACTAIPGSSRWFMESLVTYSNAAKIRLLGVAEADLNTHGAVSEPVAHQMAAGVRERAGTTWGIGVTGVAGPG
ncbi:MAG: CinA family nicotinamide mononucleotide deamidase-related protein, partial [Myxococcota bacterium]